MNGISWVLSFNTISSKAMEINIIIFNSISFVLIFICFTAIKWKEIPYPHLIAFLLMFIIIIIDLIFSSFIRYWRAKNLIKTEKKNIGNIFCIISFTISFILSLGTFLELIYFNAILEKDEKNSIGKFAYIFANVTFVVVFILSSIEKFIWCFLKGRIVNELDELPQLPTNVQIVQRANEQNAAAQNYYTNPVNGVVYSEQPIASGNIVTYNNPYNNQNNFEEDKKDNNVQAVENLNLQNQINSEVPNSQELKLK